MPEQELKDILDADIEAASGSGGIVSQLSMHGAFHVYASLPPKERIFPYNTTAERAKAKVAADALAEEHGCKPEQTLLTIQYKDTVLGRDVSHWKDDQYQTYGPIWGDVVKAIINPKRKELGITPGKKFWGRVSTVKDPWAVANPDHDRATETMPDGTMRIRHTRPFPVEVYESKEAAVAAAGKSAATTAAPDGYDAPSWDVIKGEVADAFKKAETANLAKGLKPKAARVLALQEAGEAFEVTVPWVERTL